MLIMLASSIMRTTLNLDPPVLADLKRIQRQTGKPLGEIASELLASAIGKPSAGSAPRAPFRWTSRAMRPLVDLADKDALYAALDRPSAESPEP